MRKIKIITAFDQNYEIGRLASPTHALYASLYGLPYENIEIKDFDRPAAWFKIKALLDELNKNEHEFLLWIDADAFIVDFSFDLVAAIDDGFVDLTRSFFLCGHFISDLPTSVDFIKLSKNRLNTGVMLVRNTPQSRELLEAVWAKTEYLTHLWWEQAALMDCLGYRCELTGDLNANQTNPQFADHVGALPAYMNSIPAPDNMHGSECLAPVIVHLAGLPGRMEFARAMMKSATFRYNTRPLTRFNIDLR